MINFEEELAKFKPSLEVDETEKAILNDICRRTESGWIAALAGNSKKAQTFRLLHRTFF